jgi:putative SOS response-associated peptidase YedK
MRPIHERMPVILPARDYSQWLDPANQSPDKVALLLKPYASEEMLAYPVSTRVNNPRNNDAACMEEMK